MARPTEQESIRAKAEKELKALLQWERNPQTQEHLSYLKDAAIETLKELFDTSPTPIPQKYEDRLRGMFQGLVDPLVALEEKKQNLQRVADGEVAITEKPNPIDVLGQHGLDITNLQ